MAVPPETAAAQMMPTRIISRAKATPGRSLSALRPSVSQVMIAAKVPIMKTSEWAKLINRRTP